MDREHGNEQVKINPVKATAVMVAVGILRYIRLFERIEGVKVGR